MILRGAARKTIRGLKQDPQRTIQGLLDLAASHVDGPHGSQLLGTMKTLLSQEDGQYQRLVKRLAQQVDPENLEAFFFNLGYNSCTEGVKLIRAQEEKLGVGIPWLIGLDSGGRPRFWDAAQGIVEQGKRLGVYLYLLAGEEALSPEAAALCRRHEDCAFVILAQGERLTDETARRLKQLRHGMVSVTAKDRIEWNRACGLLGREGLLFAVHAPYGTEGEAKELLTPAQLDFYASLEPAFVFLTGKPSPGGALPQVRAQVERLRLEQQYPFLLADLPGDVSAVDRMISQRSCSLAFRGGAEVVTHRGALPGIGWDRQGGSLVEVLRGVERSPVSARR